MAERLSSWVASVFSCSLPLATVLCLRPPLLLVLLLLWPRVLVREITGFSDAVSLFSATSGFSICSSFNTFSSFSPEPFKSPLSPSFLETSLFPLSGC
ncbi:hypothetical protein QJS04_geneDACA011826 [Acorus gramineus]|uniref:Secreted protein n=1 Tax=Acorus gramineus TaxID=55184 RepID=A0AAV9BHV4_ACOGR|nr:hypothetical protein QJS04_geneDACA011826 [Acorus gramineus]